MANSIKNHIPILRRWGNFKLWQSQIFFWLSGLTVGVFAVIIAKLSDYAQHLFHMMTDKIFWLPLIITPLGFALSAFIGKNWLQGTQGSGIPQVIAAIELNKNNKEAIKHLLSLKIIIGKIFLIFLGLLSGGSIGREGPTVQIGASIMKYTGKFSGFISNETALYIAGGAAGVAAAFNTPLAGIVFAIEELGKSFEQKTSGKVLITVMLAGFSSFALVGSYTYFGNVNTIIPDIKEFYAIFICGIVGGLFGGGFSNIFANMVKNAGTMFGGIILKRSVAFAALCGFLIALIGVISGQNIFGTGYNEAKALLAGSGDYHFGFGILKIISTLLSSLSGIAGGLFAPSLSAGAGLGADLHIFTPNIPIATMAILGMVGYFSGVVQSPLTAFTIVLEMTNDHNMIIPLMATSMIGYSFSKLICRRPLYHSLAQNFIKKANAQKNKQ